MKSIKTYGVRGLMECVYYIPVGKAKLRLNFSGGVLTAYGNTPARYTTSDPVRQAIIEHSDLFKGGKIVLLRQRVIEQDQAEDNQTAQAGGHEDTPKSDRFRGPREDTPLQAGGNESRPYTGDGLTPKSFPSLAEARDYLMKEFGYASGSLGSTEKIKSAGRAHGLNITIE